MILCRAAFEKEVTMTQDDKKTYMWTLAIVGAVVVLILVSYAAGLIPAPAAE